MSTVATTETPRSTPAHTHGGCCSTPAASSAAPAQAATSCCSSQAAPPLQQVGGVTEVAPMLTLTEKAASAVKRIIEQQQQSGEQIFLRVSVVGGGCSGLKEKLDLDTRFDPKRDDMFQQHGVSVVVDRRSQMYLTGAVVEYYDQLNRTGFHIDNPNAKTKCGCGSSFSM